MPRRAFWFTTGAAAGVWAATKVQRTLRDLAPDHLAVQAAGRAAAAGRRAREFAADVRTGMAQRERELGEALGTGPGPGATAPRRALPGTAGPPTTPHTTGNEDH